MNSFNIFKDDIRDLIARRIDIGDLVIEGQMILSEMMDDLGFVRKRSFHC
ncbi:MAG: hypothetical protein ACM3QW_01020 [Ignavibacteriales bacterium]